MIKYTQLMNNSHLSECTGEAVAGSVRVQCSRVSHAAPTPLLPAPAMFTNEEEEREMRIVVLEWHMVVFG